MKKILVFLLILFINVSLFSQNDTIDRAKKDNMGQTIKDVNAYYRDKVKEIKADTSLTKAQQRQSRRELKALKRDRIHEINDGAAKRRNEEKAALKEKRIKENKEKKVKENKGRNN